MGVGCTVVVGLDDAGQAMALTRVLGDRGREVVTVQWPIERLVSDAVRAEAAVLVLGGALSAFDLRTVAHGVEDAPHLAVLVVGPRRPGVEVLVALACGIRAYLPPDSPPEAVADAVDALCAGGVVVPGGTHLPLVAGPRRGERGITADRADGRTVELTPREWDVLVLLRQAFSTAEIADRLVVSPVTIRTHVAALVRKLGVRDRTALADPFPEAAEVLRKTNTPSA